MGVLRTGESPLTVSFPIFVILRFLFSYKYKRV